MVNFRMISLGAVDKTNATKPSTIDGTIPEQWSQEVEDYVHAHRFMERFVVKKTDLISKAGDTIHVFKRTALTATGDLTETSVLEGNEEKLSFSTVNFNPTKKGNAIRITAEAQAESILDLRSEAVTLLGDWAANKRDLDIHTAARSGVTTTVYANSKASAATLIGSDKCTPADISKIKTKLLSTGVPKFQPSDTPGMNDGYYVAVLHPYQVYDLTQNSTYTTAASQTAAILAGKAVGPMYQGFDAFWDGCMIYQTSNCRFATTGGYSIKIGVGYFFGPRALAEADGIFKMGPGYIWKEKMFDYEQDWGIALIYYSEAKVLNSDQIIAYYSAATDLS